ncbi:MAG: FliG C-terminal domain-containing protein [Pirellulales bacterium]
MDNTDPGLRKAAVLIATLGAAQAEKLLGQLTPVQAAQVRTAVAKLQELDPEERDEVIEQFVHGRFVMRAIGSGGVDLDEGLAARFTDVSEMNSSTEPASPETKTTTERAAPPAPFRFLDEADPQSLVPFLMRERPQTVAVVLSYLSPARAADALTALPRELQVEVVRRLADLDSTDHESVRVVERELQDWMDQQRQRNHCRDAGLTAVNGILEAAGARHTQAILAALRERDQGLANRLGGDPTLCFPSQASTIVPLSFDQVTFLDGDSMEDLLREAEPELVLLALAGTTDVQFQRIVRLLPKPEARALRRRVDHLGPTRLTDVVAAQQELAALATRLRSQTHSPAESRFESVAV